MAPLVGMHDGLIIQSTPVFPYQLVYCLNDKCHLQRFTELVRQYLMRKRIQDRSCVSVRVL